MHHRRTARSDGTSWAARASSALIACAGLAALLCIVLGGTALAVGESRPTTRLTSVARPWTTTTTFGWSGTAAASDVYPDGRVQSPQPVFLRLLSDVTVTADVTSVGPVPGGRSPLTLRATLGDGTGWNRTWALDRAVGGAGSLHLSAPLRLGVLLDETTWNQFATGVQSPVTLTLAVDPGRAGVPSPQLTFSLDRLLLKPLGPLTTSTAGSVAVHTSAAGTVPLAGRSVPVANLRKAGALLVGAGLIVAVAVVAGGGARRWGRRPRRRTAVTPVRVDVPVQRWPTEDFPTANFDTVVTVETIDSATLEPTRR